MIVPQTQYARSGDVLIACQVVGEGPIDIVLIPPYLSNIELYWELPSFARFFGQLSSFARLILFDRRGSGMSEGGAGMTPLEETIDDVQAVIDRVGSRQPVLISTVEGCGLSALFAASHPDRVRALVLITPEPRLVAGPGYEWALSPEERDQQIQEIVETWGIDSPDNPIATLLSEGDEKVRATAARLQRLAMSPADAAIALRTIGETDVRDVLGSIQCPTLVLRLEDDDFLDPRHSLYVAEQVPDAIYAELPGSGAFWIGGEDVAADEIRHFLTGARRPVASDRVLATVMFTDIVGSTEIAADLGDGAWRELLESHDRVVREEVERHRGRFVKSLGDGTLAVFDGPSRAISSAVAARERVHELGLTIRAGLHTGECELLPDGDVGGLAVHIGARVSGLAEPGEVLVSSTVRDLVVGSGQTLADRGEHELKGVPDSWRIFAVSGDAAARAR